MQELKILKAYFQQEANEAHQLQMEQYMRKQFSFVGMKAPMRAAIQKKWLKEFDLKSVDFPTLIMELWEQKVREYQLTAVDSMKNRSARNSEERDIELIEKTIVTKSWWDTVDLIARNHLEKYFQKFPEQIDPVSKRWMSSDNRWLQRSCLRFQRKFKEKTNFALVADYIKQVKNIDGFFIQKTIGWNLRQYSKFSPETVKSFIEEENIQGLARKETSTYAN